MGQGNCTGGLDHDPPASTSLQREPIICAAGFKHKPLAVAQMVMGEKQKYTT